MLVDDGEWVLQEEGAIPGTGSCIHGEGSPVSGRNSGGGEEADRKGKDSARHRSEPPVVTTSIFMKRNFKIMLVDSTFVEQSGKLIRKMCCDPPGGVPFNRQLRKGDENSR